MKITKSTIWAFVLLVLAGSLYRVWEGRPFGFAPQIAMALFGGAVIKDKRLAFILPLLSLFISDVLYFFLYENGLTPLKGLYKGQWANYLLLAGITLFGMLMKKVNVKNVIGFTIASSVLFFIFSNFFVWLGGAGLERPQTFEGLMLCYGDALAFHRDWGMIKGFYANQVLGDLIFSTVLFGSFYLINTYVIKPKPVMEAAK
jgi:hypothetical protein